jgi:hypothetical protein
VRFGGNKIGVVWDFGDWNAFYFTFHIDGAPDNQWSSPVSISHQVDNHINLKSLQADPNGQIYAVVKNDCNENNGWRDPACAGSGPTPTPGTPVVTPTPNPSSPLIWLFTISTTGVQSYTVSTSNDNQTRPSLLIDSQNRNLYVFATTGPPGIRRGGQTGINYKMTSMDNIQFPPGQGTPFIWSSTSPAISNGTTTKQDVTSASGIVLLAGDDTTRTYFHNVISLSGGSTPTATPVGTTPTPIGTPGVCQVRFEDVPSTNPFYSFITCLACHDIISGYNCGGAGEPCNGNHDPYFRSGANVTRGQIAKIVGNAAGFNDPVSGQHFQDVPPNSAFYQYVERMSQRGIISGYRCGSAGEPCVAPANKPYFRPNANATRGQISKIVVNTAVDTLGWTLLNPATSSFQDVAVGSAFYQYIETAYSHQVISGYRCGSAGEPCVAPQNKPYFRANTNATRGQTSKIVSNSFFPNCSPAAPQPYTKP